MMTTHQENALPTPALNRSMNRTKFFKDVPAPHRVLRLQQEAAGPPRALAAVANRPDEGPLLLRPLSTGLYSAVRTFSPDDLAFRSNRRGCNARQQMKRPAYALFVSESGKIV